MTPCVELQFEKLLLMIELAVMLTKLDKASEK